MANYNTAIHLEEHVTSVLNFVSQSINKTINQVNNLHFAFESPIKIEAWDAVSNSVSKIEEEMSRVRDQAKTNAEVQAVYNDAVQKGEQFTANMSHKLTSMIGALASLQNIKKLVDFSDEMAGYDTKLRLLVDENSVASVKDQIYQAAQASRSSYTEMMASVAQMGAAAGAAFRGADGSANLQQVIRFQELMNKNFIIGGASAQEQAAAMQRLTQAMGSGQLQANDYDALIAAAPQLAQGIEGYMTRVQGATGSVQDWAAAGLLTAEVLKNAVFSAADATETSFAAVPMTWAQVLSSLKNDAVSSFQPVFAQITALANDADTLTFLAQIRRTLSVVGGIVSWVVGVFVRGAKLVMQNWGFVSAVIRGVVVAVGLVAAAYAGYIAVQAIHNVQSVFSASSKYEEAKAALAAASAVELEHMAKEKAIVSQAKFNTVLLASPLFTVIAVIVGIVVAIGVVIAVVKKFGHVNNSVLGIVMGGLGIAWAAIKNGALWIANIAIGVWESMKAVASNIKIAFFNSIYGVQGFFYSLVATVLYCVAQIANALNRIPFVNFDVAGLEASADAYAQKAIDAVNKRQEYEKLSDAFDRGNSTFEVFQDGWAADAYNKAAAKGDEWTQKLKDKFGQKSENEALGLEDYLGEIETSTAAIAGSADDIADSVSASESDLKYLRKIAEREAINRFTTAEIHLDFTSNATVNSNIDVDGMINTFTGRLQEALVTTAERLEA